MRKTLFCFACVMFLYAAVSFAAPSEPIGTLTFIEGVCDLSRDGQESAIASERQDVYLNDRIRTKSYSKAEIVLVDKSVVRLAPNTCILLEEFRLTENKKREFARLKLTRGKIEAVVAKTGAPDTFVVDTPNARGSVKGSDIFISYFGGRTGVFVQEGAISVLNPSLPQLTTKIPQGNCVMVPFDKAPEEARAVLDAEMLSHKRDVARALIKKWVPSKGSAQMNAVIVSMSGTARIYKKGAADWSEPKLNDTVSEGDKLQTGDNGRVEIKFNNGNTLLIQANTELGFTTLRYDQPSGNYENTLQLAYGKVSGVVEKISKQSTFQLKTPTAVCAVRGTFLEVNVPAPTPNQPLPPTQVFYEGGAGIVTSTISGQTQQVGAGQNVGVDSAGNVSPPATTTVEQKSEISQSLAGSQVVDNYAGSQGAVGSGGSPPKGALPPPPPPGAGPGGFMKPPLNDNMQNMNKMSNLNFDQVLKPPPPPPPNPNIYVTNLPVDVAPAGVTMSESGMSLSVNKLTGDWTGNLHAKIYTSISSNWSVEFHNVVNNDKVIVIFGDPITFGTNDPIIPISLGGGTPEINGLQPSRSLTLDSSCSANYDSSTQLVKANIFGTSTPQ